MRDELSDKYQRPPAFFAKVACMNASDASCVYARHTRTVGPNMFTPWRLVACIRRVEPKWRAQSFLGLSYHQCGRKRRRKGKKKMYAAYAVTSRVRTKCFSEGGWA